MVFKDKEHLDAYERLIERDATSFDDLERKALFYILTLSEDIRMNINEIYNFEKRLIKPLGLEQPWQTNRSRRLTQLAFNLCDSLDSKDRLSFSAIEIFYNSDARYIVEAIKLRLRSYF